MAKNIVHERTCAACNIPKPANDYFQLTRSIRFPEREHTCKPCLQIKRFWSYVSKGVTCWVWTGKCNADGYGVFDHTSAHRFSWGLHNGPIPTGMCVLHRCDNPPCVRPEHLYSGTKKRNYQDMIDRQRAGADFLDRQNQAILTPKIVRQARAMYATGGYTCEQIREALGLKVAPVTMQQAISGATWKHVV